MTTTMEAVGDLIRDATPSLGTYIDSNGVGTLVCGVMPESPDLISAVFQNPGQSPMFTMGDGGSVIRRPMIQVIVRGAPNDFQTPFARANDILRYLETICEVTKSGVNFMRIEPVGEVNTLGVDAHHRYQFSMNFLCQTKP
jgi:hypothetical protein